MSTSTQESLLTGHAYGIQNSMHVGEYNTWAARDSFVCAERYGEKKGWWDRGGGINICQKAVHHLFRT